jgi:replicative DNA helicase
MSDYQRTPPHNINAEKAILGAIILNKTACEKALTAILPTDLYLMSHRTIFEAVLALNGSHSAIDTITVTEKLESNDELVNAGGFEYLAELTNFVPSVANIEDYCRIVKGLSNRRQMIEIAGKLTEASFEDEDYESTLDKFQTELNNIESAKEDTDKTLSEFVEQAIINIEYDIKNKDNIKDMPTGFPDIDRMIEGLRPGEITVVAGIPGSGKTTFVCNMMYRVQKIRSDIKSLFISCEMTGNETAERALSYMGDVEALRIRGRRLQEYEWKKIMSAADKAYDYNIIIEENPRVSLRDIARLIKKHGSNLVVIDYLQIMKPIEKLKERRFEIDAIMNELKAMSKDLNCHIILLSQLSRGVNTRSTKRPVLSDLKESSGIEQATDIVMFIYRNSIYSKDEDDKSAEIIISKARGGKTGTVFLEFNGDKYLFYEGDNT